MADWTQGGPHQWQVPPGGDNDIAGYTTINSFGIRDEWLFEDLKRALRVLLRCTSYFPCLHAGRVNGFKISVDSNGDIVLTHGDGTTYTLTSDDGVSGPASSTDNAIVRFDGTGGKTLQNSGVLIDDSDNITGVESIDPNTIELGGEAGNTDTTITRSAAGVVAVEGVDLLRADQNLSDVDDYSAALSNLCHLRDVQTADAGISSTTMTATELNVSIAGSKRHLIRATFFIDSTSSAGFKIDFGGGTIGLDDMKLLYTISDSSSGDVVDTGRVTSLTGVIQPSSNITGQYEVRVSGVIATNADSDPGTLIVRHARAGFGGTSTFQENSELEVIEV